MIASADLHTNGAKHMKMTAAQARRSRHDEVRLRWDARPVEHRRLTDGMEFADEMWSAGLRLADGQHVHYQHIMDLIRFRTADRE